MKHADRNFLWLTAGACTALSSLSFAVQGPQAGTPLTPLALTRTLTTPTKAAARVPARIVENRGQFDARVLGAVAGSGRQVFFTRTGVKVRILGERGSDSRAGHVLELGFAGANPNAEVVFESTSPGTVQYFRGERAAWRTGVKAHGAIVYRKLWKGIDARYSLEGSALKYQFTVAPGANPADIRFEVRGAGNGRLGLDGALALEAGAFELQDGAPVAWQGEGASRQRIDAAFAIENGDGFVGLGFAVGAFDRSRELVIDPTLIVQSGFLGGSGEDWATSVTMDSSKNLYVCGTTDSDESKFPEVAGPDLTFNSVVGYDAFIAKLDPTGTQLVYLGYLGGYDSDGANEVAVDNAGCAYVTGYTRSSTGEDFPIANGPKLTFGGGQDAFVAKLSASGSILEYCGYIGGTGDYDGANAIAVDAAGNAYVGGITNSSSASFPVIAGPDLTSNGNYDGFVAKVNPQGTGFVFCGYVGGGSSETVTGVAVDAANRMTFCGTTASSHASFPVSTGPDLTYNGEYDAFVARLNANGIGYVYNGFIGGSDDDEAKSLSLDSQGNAIVVGYTDSLDFPVLTGPGILHAGGGDGFVVKVNNAGTALAWSGFLGGSGDDMAFDVDIDPAGDAYVAGWTTSKHNSLIPFPVAVGPDLTHGGKTDGFLAKLAGSTGAIQFAGFLGGSGDDLAYAVKSDGAGSAWVVGYCTSSAFPRFGAMDVTYNGGVSDATLTKVKTFELEPPSPAATIDIVECKATLVASPLADKDTLRVSGTFAYNGNSPDAALAPSTEDLAFAAGDVAHPIVFSVPAGTPGWTVKNGRSRWSSPKGATPKVTITVDATKKTFQLTVLQANLPGPIENPISLEMAIGNDYVRKVAVWEQKKAGTFTLK